MMRYRITILLCYCRRVSAHLAAGADLLPLGAWITDPKGGLMCSAAIPESHQERMQQQLQHHQHDDAIIWSEACATMSARAALTAEMQVGPRAINISVTRC